MASQKYTTLGQGTLSSAYTAGATSLVLGTGQGATFPSSGDFVVALNDPPSFFLKCTARSGDTLTVAAGAVDGTTASNQAIGVTVTEVITATVLDGIRSDSSAVGTRANLPATSEAHKGDRYKCTDSQYEFIYDGSVWQPFVYGWNVVEPILSDFSWVNQGTASATGTQGGIVLQTPAASGDNIRLLARALPSSPYTITALILPSTVVHTNYQNCGIALYDSASGKLSVFSVLCNGAVSPAPSCQIIANKMTNVTTLSATYTAINAEGLFAGPMWLRIKDDGTNRLYQWSRDAQYWETIHTIGRTDFLTPDKAGPMVNAANTSWGVAQSVLSWKQA